MEDNRKGEGNVDVLALLLAAMKRSVQSSVLIETLAPGMTAEKAADIIEETFNWMNDSGVSDAEKKEKAREILSTIGAPGVNWLGLHVAALQEEMILAHSLLEEIVESGVLNSLPDRPYLTDISERINESFDSTHSCIVLDWLVDTAGLIPDKIDKHPMGETACPTCATKFPISMNFEAEPRDWPMDAGEVGYALPCGRCVHRKKPGTGADCMTCAVLNSLKGKAQL